MRPIEEIRNWHPFTQMATAPKPTLIKRAKGEFLYDEQDNAIIDAISSWWVNLHGHSNSYVSNALAKQASIMEHVLFAGFTHPQAEQISERLQPILPIEKGRFLFSDDGSTAVEVALKMSMQYFYNQNKHTTRRKYIAIEGSYHGDTFGSMSVATRSAFSDPFDVNLFDCTFIPLPTEENIQECLDIIETAGKSREYAGFIFEPLNLGTAGMLQYPTHLLQQLISKAKEYEILCIADEVMTGFGRTGSNFATSQLNIQPDIICLSKGLTAGYMAMGLTVASERIYTQFHSEDKMKCLFHGHSYTANPLGCAVANASLDLLLSSGCQNNIQDISNQHKQFKAEFESSEKVKEIRALGTILAVEYNVGEETGYFNSVRDRLYKQAMDQGVLLRPLGNVLYTLPMYSIQQASLDRIYSVLKGIEI